MNVKTIRELRDSKINFDESIFLTFDIDWCSDFVLSFCLDLLEEKNIGGTFFITHDTPLLNRIRENPKMELGIHPNFNFLLNGDFRYGKNFKEVVDYYLKIVPEAISVRSHSLVQSSGILDYFDEKGLVFDVNLLIPRNSGIELKLFKSWSKNLIRVPYFWEDDTHILYKDINSVDYYLNTPGLKVFDFHPIHIYLNTEDLNRYEKIKSDVKNKSLLDKHINDTSFGSLDFFKEILKKL